MSNKVWVFGDSFSENVSSIPKDSSRRIYSKKYLNKDYYKIWPDYICDELDYEIKNFAAIDCRVKKFDDDNIISGNSNDDMFLQFSDKVHEIQKGDIVFLGFTEIARFKMPSIKYKDRVQGILPSMVTNDIREEMGDLIDALLINRLERQDWYFHYFMTLLKSFKELSIVKGFKLYAWSWVHDFNLYLHDNNRNLDFDTWFMFRDYFFEKLEPSGHHLNQHFRSNGIKSTIYEETNGDVDDYHWTEDANKMFGEMCVNLINRDLNLNNNPI
jgi:hypothetical protein